MATSAVCVTGLSGTQILVISNLLDKDIQILPKPEYAFRPDDVLIAMGHIESLEKVKLLAEK